MRARTVVVLGLAAAAMAAVVARRRRATPSVSAAQVGLVDGTVRRLAGDEPGRAPLRERAAELRRALEAGS